MTRPTRLPRLLPLTALLILLATTAGCETEDQEVRELMIDLTRRHAAQQESLQRQSQALSETSREMVTADGQARKELIAFQERLQQDVQAEREDLNRQRDALEAERRQLAGQRHRDPLLATALIQAVTLIIATLPVIALILLLRLARQEPESPEVNELLVETLLDNPHPRLLPSPDEPTQHIPENPTHE
jgi:hypothetical protein